MDIPPKTVQDSIRKSFAFLLKEQDVIKSAPEVISIIPAVIHLMLSGTKDRDDIQAAITVKQIIYTESIESDFTVSRIGLLNLWLYSFEKLQLISGFRKKEFIIPVTIGGMYIIKSDKYVGILPLMHLNNM